NEVGRGERAGLLRLSRGRSWVRIPPGPVGARASVDRAPHVPDRMFPSSDFRSLHLRKQRKEAVIKRSVTKNEVGISKQRFRAQGFRFALIHRSDCLRQS